MLTEDDQEAYETFKAVAGKDGRVIASKVPDTVSSVNIAHLEKAGALNRHVIEKQTYFEVVGAEVEEEE